MTEPPDFPPAVPEDKPAAAKDPETGALQADRSPVVQPMIEVLPAGVPEISAEQVAEDRRIAIARNDDDVERELRGRSRRGFIVAGISAVAGVGAWEWLRSRPKIDGVEWPMRRTLEVNEELSDAYFRTARLTPTFPRSEITPERINGGLGLNPAFDPATWRLRIEGGGQPVSLSLADIKALPRREMITEFRCIEGWSIVVQWAGARLSDLMQQVPPTDRQGRRADLRDWKSLPRYVSMETPDRGYYVGLDIQSAIHPQTLLAYEMNGRPLTWQHGAPLRLAIPVKYGVKNIKRIGTIRYTDVRPADYWAEQGYDWYAGH
ncbi:MAG: molybdopterin-dependent oxidoreductase [Thermoanaerobaculia bacterium]